VLGPVSNGEFLPPAAAPADVGLARAVLDRAASAADALAIDRRLFLQTAGGMAALLTTINLAACTSQAHTSARSLGPAGHSRRQVPDAAAGGAARVPGGAG
jgi:hypothetical protein